MTPRSLVGMTMGCRKRVVRARCWEAGYTLRRNRFSLTSDQLRALDVTERAECAKIRETYRIGQRLRPCPGCRKCGYEPTVKMWKLSRDALWMSGRLGVRDIRNICDGSGVLPAKGKVRR